MIILASSALLAEAADVVTVESLLGRMTDTRWLATPPQAGERTVQFSSYDRASRLVDGKIINPFANGDRGHYLRAQGEGKDREWVLAEAQGPGYVSRIWSANPDGELRIYVDGSKTPALAAPFAAITSGEVKPFGAPFGHDASRGRNLYFPFPFAKSIKISTTKGDQYFQVSVTTSPAGTKVESYSPEVLKRSAEAIEESRRELLSPPLHDPFVQPVKEFRGVSLAAGQSADLIPESWSQGRSGALVGLVCHVKAANTEDALARTLLTITFDGVQDPQVTVPLGEFFGSGPGINPFETLIDRVDQGGLMVANWYMPFRKSVRVRLTNFTDQPITVAGGVSGSPEPPPEDFLYFHARWRYQDNLQTKKADGTIDWPALHVSEASGRFVGLLLNVFNPTPAWWGEGDEKIYVDGESFPSTFGTGTEDYFGYAWSDNHTYMNPFHSQTRCDGPGTKGNSSNIRYQILDSVPFQKSLNFDLEVWHWEAVKVQYATIAYFYAAPGARIEPDIPDLSTRKVYPKPPIKREPGVVEGEDLKVKTKTAGDVPNQDMTPFGDAWSGASQLWWVVHEPRARLDLELPVEKAGTYAISAAFTKAGDYGAVQLAINGRPLRDPIDLYAPFPKVLHTGAILLGNAMLEAGPQTLSITVTGKNAKSTNYLVGLDWIKLTPTPTGSFPGRNEGGNRR
jgi:Protein of unknown function (DUF2961)